MLLENFKITVENVLGHGEGFLYCLPPAYDIQAVLGNMQ